MRVLVTGATGFIGSHIVRALKAAGHSVTAASRDTAACEKLHPGIPAIECDFTRDITPSAWEKRLANIDIMINAVGIITETGRNRFDAVQVKGTKALFDGCKRAGIHHVIHISALGIAPDSPTAYSRTRLEADAYLLSLGIPALVLRPSWLYGEASRSFEVLCAYSVLPRMPVTGKGQYLVQPISVTDFAAAVCRLMGNHALDGQVVEAGGPDKITIADIHRQLRSWLGMEPVTTVAVPEGFVKLFVKLGDTLFKGPINSASFDMLTRHNVTDDTRLWKTADIWPSPFAASLAGRQSNSAERQHASLFFLLPFLRLSLAFLWMASGLITAFLTPHKLTLALFFETGLTGLPADMVLYYGSTLLDFLMGLTLLFNWRLERYGVFQIALILFYTLFVTYGAPQWWLHPYGPLIKNIPLIPATLIVMAVSGRKA